MPLNLVLNPGSTSTKIGVYDDNTPVFTATVQHSQEALKQFDRIVEQTDFRERVILELLTENGIALGDIGGVISIGGLIRPGDAGVYEINQAMVDDLRNARYYEHASNVGALIAKSIADKNHIKAYIADAVTVDERCDEARLSGIPEINRQGRSHTLNQKGVARRAAVKLGRRYEDCYFVVAHLGGGISIAAHKAGRIADVTMARGEGTFSVDRAGGVNSYELAKLCFSGELSRDEVMGRLNGSGGILAYLGTRDFKEVTEKVEAGDERARHVYEALVYQISKDIGAMTAALGRRPDAIILTGGMANSKMLTADISKQVSFLGDIFIQPGEVEMEALEEYLINVQRDPSTAIKY